MNVLQDNSSSIRDGVQYVIVSWPIQKMKERGRAFWEVMMVDLSSLPTIHVLHAHTDPQSSCNGTNMDVVTLPVHRIYFLQ